MRLALAGGGTGGHLIPGLAVAEELEKDPGSESLFFLSPRDPESFGASLARCRLVRPPSAPLRGGILGRSPGWFLANLAGFRRSRSLLAGFRPDAILGLGGFVSAPAVLAAASLRIPVVLCEQNTVPGRANVLLSRFARRVALGFPLRRGRLKGGRQTVTGNPILPSASVRGPETLDREWGLRDGLFTLLVMGGSRGAHFLNRLLIESAPRWGEWGRRIQFLHLAGPREAREVRDAYGSAGIAARVWPSWDRMGWLYGRADLLIARAGALTLAEAAHWGLPSCLIPYPFARDGHQTENAAYFREAGAAIAREEKDWTPASFVQTVTGLLGEDERLLRMGRAARKLAHPDSARKILALIEEAIREKPQTTNTKNHTIQAKPRFGI